MAVGVRSSSIMQSSFRSISSRRRKIRERLSSEVMTTARKRPHHPGWGTSEDGASVGRADQTFGPLHSAMVGELWRRPILLSHIVGPIPISRSDPIPGLVRSRQRFVHRRQGRADGFYQQGNLGAGLTEFAHAAMLTPSGQPGVAPSSARLALRAPAFCRGA